MADFATDPIMLLNQNQYERVVSRLSKYLDCKNYLDTSITNNSKKGAYISVIRNIENNGNYIFK